MTATFTYRYDDVQARRAFMALDAAAGDLSPLMDNIGALLEDSARIRIEQTNSAPDGVAWPKSLRASGELEVLEGQEAKASNGITLFDSGQLADSLTHEAGRDRVEIGSNKIYAGVHQFGATITAKDAGGLFFVLPNGQAVVVGKVTIPARPYLGVSEADASGIEALVAEFLNISEGVQ